MGVYEIKKYRWECCRCYKETDLEVVLYSYLSQPSLWEPPDGWKVMSREDDHRPKYVVCPDCAGVDEWG